MHFSLVATFIINCVGYLQHTKHFLYILTYTLHIQLLLKQITGHQFSANDELLDPQRYSQHYSV